MIGDRSFGSDPQKVTTYAGAYAQGLRVVEVPITFVEREVGDSKMSGDIVRESLLNVTSWGLKYRAAQARSLAKRVTGGRNRHASD